MAGEEGPSKNELKKLAKKAEKAAKKQAASGGDPPPAQAAPSAPPAPAASKPTTTPPKEEATEVVKPRLLLGNLTSSTDAAALKVVWTARHFQVPLEAASPAQVEAAPSSFFKGPVLLSSSDSSIGAVAGGGGNAMAQAVAALVTTSDPSPTRTLSAMMVDEWCEWERTVLRSGKPTAKDMAKLVMALESHAGLGILGPTLTVADICVLVTLSTLDASILPPAVKAYVAGHQAGLEAAKVALADLQTAAAASSSSTVVPPFEVDYTETSLNKTLDAVFRVALTSLFGNILDVPALPQNMVTRCSNPKHGDYQCTAAMPVFGQLKKLGNTDYKSPKDVATAIIQALGTDHPVVTDLTTNGPGFVLCKLQAAFLKNHVQRLFQKDCQLPLPQAVEPATCVVDFSSPNIAKEMHVGHLRSTIIGESVCRILESVGHKVHRVNHVGDWGTQFGMLIQYLQESFPIDTESDTLPNITDLTGFYKNAKQRFDESPEFKLKSQTNVVALQSGDPECLKVWKMLCDVSRKEFEKVYVRLDVNVTEVGESFYNDKISAVIEEFKEKGLITEEEGGAKCIFSPKFKIPLMVQKSDGGYGYDSTDMAALHYRLKTLGAARIIVITDFSQGDHFKMIYEAGRSIGWVDKEQRLEHIGFGTVNGEDGKRFKTRSGETVRLVDLLDEAVSRMEASLKERIIEGKANITEAELHETAEAIGYGAVKYYDLRRNPTSNYKFSYDQMLDTKGDTAVYLLYARVRLESIIAKAKELHGVDVEELIKSGHEVVLEHPSELNVALHLQYFTDTLELTLEDLFPYHICDYVYKLANAASDFVTQCKVLGSDEMKSRLLLCHVTAQAMKQCFDLLGIRNVKRI